ncbi:MAG: SLC13 family permease [Deltaproteobacteria bacterium]|nr:SLC13 family permease [Deltaproteobacteria bacterium]
MLPLSLTGDMILVFLVIAVVIFLFVVEWVRVDVVAILAMVVLPLLGLLDGRETFSGFGSTAVISIIAVIIMGRGLDHTGVIGRVVRPLVHLAGRLQSSIIMTLSVMIACISSVMQNVGAAALFLPALRRISRDSRIPLSKLLMPVGSAAILGGTVTLVGSSPLIMLNDLLEHHELPPFHLFSVTPIGLALVVTGIAYFIFMGRHMLPGGEEGNGEESDGFSEAAVFYGGIGELFELTVPERTDPSLTVSKLCDGFLVHTVALRSHDGRTKLFPPDRDQLILPRSTIAVFGPRGKVEEAAAAFGFRWDDHVRIFDSELSSDISGVVEGVVAPHSKFIGKSLQEIRFRHNYLLAPLAVFRSDKAQYTNLGEVVLRAGDAILMHGTWERLQQLHHGRDLLFSHSIDHEVLNTRKAGVALLCFALATALAVFTDLSLPVCLMSGALGMVLTRVITIEEAYRGVDWRTVFLLAGLIPLGLAAEKSGAAAWLAQQILAWLDQPSPLLLLSLVGVLSTVFSLVVSNVGAIVLLVPLVVNLAQDTGLDPRLAALVAGIAASNSFLLPTHQVNALYMGPGGYTSKDFLRVGTPLSLIFLIVLTIGVHVFY